MEEEEYLQAEISGSEDEGEDGDERKHNQLVDAISSLDGKKRHKLSQRTVLTTQVSEFNFATSRDRASKVNLNELAGVINDNTKLGNIKRQLNVVKKGKKVVSVPLPKHEKQKIDRTVAYESTSKDVSKWDPVVKKNRQAEQLQFPLQKPDLQFITTDNFVKRFQLRTPLELQVAALLQGSDHVIQKDQEMSPAEERALRAMDVEEARERRAELMKYKALLSYKEAKIRWSNKIKSKSYRRMLKKDRLKKEKKSLDQLEKTDPESYAEKVKQLNKDRIEERMSLKHRGGSKYARKKMIYAKYDDKAREEVQDMLQKSREITKKVDVPSDSDAESEGGVSLHSEEENVMLESQLHSEMKDNPWMQKILPAKKANSLMAKPVVETGSEYSRPSEFKDKSAEIERKSEIVEENIYKENEDSGIAADKSVVNVRKISSPTSSHERKLVQKDSNSTSVNVAETKNSDDAIDKIFDQAQKKSVMSKKAQKKSVMSKKGDKNKSKKDRKKGDNKSIVDKNSSVKDRKDKTKSVKDMKDGKKKAKLMKKNRKLKVAAKKSETEEDKSDKIKEMEMKAASEKAEIELNSKDVDEDDNSDDGLISEGLSRKRTIEEIEGSGFEVDEPKKSKIVPAEIGNKSKTKDKKTEKEAFVDPKKLFKLDSKLKQVGKGPNLMDSDNDNDLDADEQQRMTIAQAFADDDVIDEFRQDKREDIDKNKPKDLDLSLPGWGSWGGAGLKIPKKKKQRFIIKAAPAPKRKDKYLGNVIINEQKVPAVRRHQVNELPFPFKNTYQFERSIRAPLGKTWNPETAYKELVKPKVVTSIGKIIAPIDKSEVDKDAKKSKDIKAEFKDSKNEDTNERTHQSKSGNENKNKRPHNNRKQNEGKNKRPHQNRKQNEGLNKRPHKNREQNEGKDKQPHQNKKHGRGTKQTKTQTKK